jgi:AcrR family transcriptional regulator
MARTTTRERILKNALRLFSAHGYEGATTRAICAAAGITKPTLYYFFGSKEALYRALVDETLERFHRDLATLVEQPGTTRERLIRVMRRFFDSAQAHKDLMRFVMALVHGRPSSAPKTDFLSYHKKQIALIARIVDEGVRKQELAPGKTELRMLVFMGVLGEALAHYVLMGGTRLTPKLAGDLVEMMISGWRRR